MMRRTLVTFLGRAPRTESGYRATCYDFGDGDISAPVAFLGWPLAKRIRPDQVIILGTAGSMWDHLFETDFDLGNTQENARLALVEAVEKAAVTESLLMPLAPLLEDRLGTRVVLSLIPYCRTTVEQVELLRRLAAHVDSGVCLDLDVTHAFRHIPMIALMGALYLQKARGIEIGRIWYGAFDPDTQTAAVHDLAALTRIADWLTALSTYDKDGDYGVFSDLLPAELGSLLAEASFLENINRIGPARGKARRALACLNEHEPPDPAAALFYAELKNRLQWTNENNLYLRQRWLAIRHLERGRLLDATLSGYEAFITGLLQQQNLPTDRHADRENARKLFEEEERSHTPRTARFRDWDSLRRLRNTLVHGTSPKGEDVQRAVSGREAMQQQLSRLFDSLLPQDI